MSDQPITFNAVTAADIKRKTTLTNFDIENICHTLKLPLNGAFMKDQINLKTLKNGNFIMNLQNHDEGGSHWTAFIKKKNHIYYSDSFGCLPPQNEVNVFQMQGDKTFYNNTVLQHIDSDMCGYFSILFLYVMNQKGTVKQKYKKYVALFNKLDTKVNDQILRDIFQHLVSK
jgi:hypothetical protein